MKQQKGWRMSCDVAELILQAFSHFTNVTAHSDSPSFPSLHLRHSSFSNPSLALPTSQLILKPFRCFTYVTARSPTLLSPLLRHMIFTYVTWRAAHGCLAQPVLLTLSLKKSKCTHPTSTKSSFIHRFAGEGGKIHPI